MSYGIPYRGSKNTIAKRIIDLLPRADTFVDLFAGGCAMTHCAMGSGKYRNFIANDIGDAPQLFANAIAGKYRDERHWISREDFFALKDSDPYIRLCWSFGNGGGQYLYSKEIEPWKRALHYARVFGDRGELLKFGIVSDGSYSDIVAHLDQYKEKYIRWYWENKMNTPAELILQIEDTETEIAKTKEELRQYLCDALRASGLTQAEVGRRLGTQMQGHYFGRSQWEFPTEEHYNRMREFMSLKPYAEAYGYLSQLITLGRLKSMRSLEKLENFQRKEREQSAQNLQGLRQKIQLLQGDYRSVHTPLDCVIYCDPPYKDTAGYGVDFDHEAFYEWARQQTAPLFISEYQMPDDFVCVATIPKVSGASGRGAKITEEKLFVPRHQYTANIIPRQLSLF